MATFVSEFILEALFLFILQSFMKIYLMFTKKKKDIPIIIM